MGVNIHESGGAKYKCEKIMKGSSITRMSGPLSSRRHGAPGKAHRGRGRLPGSPLHSTYNPSQHLYLSFSRTLLMFFPYSVHFMFCSYSRHTTRLGQSKEFSRCRSRWFNVLFVPIHAVHFMHKHVWDKHTSNLYYLKLNQLEL